MDDFDHVDTELDAREHVCPRPECNLVHWTPAGDTACEFAN
jgi:hypothetical protein